MLDRKDLRIETYRGTGNGGQNRNKVESAVRITHIPTGIQAKSERQRDQGQNMKEALRVLEERIVKMIRVRKAFALNQERRAQQASGRVRTYDLTKNLCVDHRRGTRTTKVREVLDGNLDLLYNGG